METFAHKYKLVNLRGCTLPSNLYASQGCYKSLENRLQPFFLTLFGTKNKKTKKNLSILKHFFSERIVRENIYRTCAKSHRGGLLFFSSSASQNKKEFTVPKLLRYEGNVNISVNIPHSNLKNYVGPHVEGNTNTSYFCYYFNCRRLLLTDFFGTIFLL